MTIPRLELSGALLLSKLCRKTLKTLDIRFDKIYLWTDSQIVLGWINGNPKRYKTFVSTRISKINNLVNKSNWHHVSSEDNAADCASRGMLPHELIKHDMWWNGPKFLYSDASQNKSIAQPISDVELQPTTIAANVALNNFTLPDTSSSKKLLRVIAYVKRFTYNCKNTEHRIGDLTVDELENAKFVIVRHMQQEAYLRTKKK